MTSKLTSIKLATATAAAIVNAFTGAASAEKAHTYTLEFRYDAAASAETNYNAFRRLAERECKTPGLRPLAQVRLEHDCVTGILDKLVETLGRPEVAALHAVRTGHRPAVTRDYASRG